MPQLRVRSRSAGLAVAALFLAMLTSVATGRGPGVTTAHAAPFDCSVQVTLNPASPVTFGVPVQITFNLQGNIVAGRVQGSATLDGQAIAFPYLSSFTYTLDSQYGPDPSTVTFSNLVSGGHTVAWRCQDISGGSPGPLDTGTTTFSIGGGPSGQVFPKFLVLGVIYAPPGAGSTVDYSSSTQIGTKMTNSSSFQAGVSQTVTVGLAGVKIGVSTAFTQKSDDSRTVTINSSSTNGIRAQGPVADGIDHDFDQFLVWLNPGVDVTQTSATSLNLTNVSVNPNDTAFSPDLDVVHPTVRELLNPSLLDAGTASRMTRSWAGSGQGLDSNDFATILARDPFTAQASLIDNGQYTIDQGRFDLLPGQAIDYKPADVGGKPNIQTGTFTNQTTTDIGKGASDTLEVGFTRTESASFFDNLLTAERQRSLKLQWVNSHATDDVNITGQTAAFSVTGPPTGYQGPTGIKVYKDDVYGSFMFTFAAVPTFELTTSTPSQTVVAGSGTSYAIGSQSDFGFSGSLSFSPTVGGLPAGATATISPTSVSVGSGVNVAVTTDVAQTPPGTYPLTITATSGIITRHITVNLVVNPPPFTMTVTPPSMTISSGQNATYTVTTTAAAGFSGPIDLQVVGLPPNSTATFNPVTITGSGTSTLTVTTSSSTPAGTSTLTVSGTGGGTTQNVPVQLIVNNTPDFNLSVSPQAAGVAAGGTATYTVTITAVNGFTGNVSLSVNDPPNATHTFNPNPVAGAGTSTLTVSTSTSTPPGNYDLTVTGTSGSLPPKQQTVTLTVSDFTVAASPSTQTVSAGSGTSYSVSTAAVNGFSDPVAFNVTGLPAGATATYPSSVTGAATANVAVSTSATTPAGTYTLTITGTSGALSHSTTVSLTVNPPPPGFSLWTDSTGYTVFAGDLGGAAATVGTTALNGFSGPVTLSASGLPATVNADSSPNPVDAGGSTSMTMTASSDSPAANYTVTVTGTGGGVTATTTVTLSVCDVSGICPAPPSNPAPATSGPTPA